MLTEAPRMGYKLRGEGPAPYDKQARIIADLIKDCPPEWCGVIHHTSIKESKSLTQRLSHLGLRSRLWSPEPRTGTEAQMEAWHEYRQRVPNAIAACWG